MENIHNELYVIYMKEGAAAAIAFCIDNMDRFDEILRYLFYSIDELNMILERIEVQKEIEIKEATEEIRQADSDRNGLEKFNRQCGSYEAGEKLKRKMIESSKRSIDWYNEMKVCPDL